MTNRQPKGIPVGGQFAEGRNPAGSDLPTNAPTGNVSNVQVGSRSPWGTIDNVTHMAPGIVSVSTPGHGGVKLSPERNKQIPAPLRNASGWYEEDCESYIPMMAFPEAFVRGEKTVDDMRKAGESGVREWFPEGFEKAFGVELEVGESGSKDRATWHELHQNDEVAISARGYGDDIPEGMVVVTVRRGGRSNSDGNVADREVLVPNDDYDNLELRHPLGKHGGSFVVDPSKNYVDVTPAPKPPKEPAVRYRTIDTSKATATGRQRIEHDLRKQFRFRNTGIKTLQEIVEEGGIAGKSFTNKGADRKSYYLRMASEAEGQPATDSFYALEVSKATWDAVDAPAN